MNGFTRLASAACAICIASISLAQTGGEPSPAKLVQAQEMRDKAVAYLLSKQDDDTGGWSVRPDGPNLPAITGLVLLGMTADSALPTRDDATKQAVDRAYEFLYSYQQGDDDRHQQSQPAAGEVPPISAVTPTRQDTQKQQD